MKAKRVLCAAIIWVISLYGMAGQRGPQSLRAYDFENHTYQFAGQAFRVENGRYESTDDQKPIESLDVAGVKFGRLTQTSHEDAVVLTRYSGGGTGLFDALHVFKLRNNQPVLVGSIEGGDRADGGIKTFYIENGSLYVVSYDREQNACSACFDFERTTEYKWTGQELKSVWQSEARKIAEPEKESLELEIDGANEEEVLPAVDSRRNNVAAAAGKEATRFYLRPASIKRPN